MTADLASILIIATGLGGVTAAALHVRWLNRRGRVVPWIRGGFTDAERRMLHDCDPFDVGRLYLAGRIDRDELDAALERGRVLAIQRERWRRVVSLAVDVALVLLTWWGLR